MLKKIGFVINYLGRELCGFAYDAIGIYAFPRSPTLGQACDASDYSGPPV
jgi:hypothetical protein